MEDPNDRTGRAIQFVEWTARFWSLVSIGLVLAFIFGEGVHPATPGEWLGFLFFPLGIAVGMAIGWWREGLGGAVTVGCLVAFYLVHLTTSGRFPSGWAWLVFAAPGFLFLLGWAGERRHARAPHARA